MWRRHQLNFNHRGQRNLTSVRARVYCGRVRSEISQSIASFNTVKMQRGNELRACCDGRWESEQGSKPGDSKIHADNNATYAKADGKGVVRRL